MCDGHCKNDLSMQCFDSMQNKEKEHRLWLDT